MDWDMDDIFKHENAIKIAASQKMDDQVKQHLREEHMAARMSTDPVKSKPVFLNIENRAFLTDNKCRVIPSEYSNNQLPLELPLFEYSSSSDDTFTSNDLHDIAPQNCQIGLETGETETPDASGNYELHPHVKILYDQYLPDMIGPLKKMRLII
ncbi:hypothetical protein CEXT_323441 [Caerostris extrusa]|uniref:Uncharacterized protein n=1 Tax=Caerostris extrusa TaxID=172846 RepID=A0AAV4SB64_CAEEX|nr:hypothetical protein CEXT_323441 [Caerostris extrusa]